MREGIARLLAEAGFDVVSQAGDAEAFLRKAFPKLDRIVAARIVR